MAVNCGSVGRRRPPNPTPDHASSIHLRSSHTQPRHAGHPDLLSWARAGTRPAVRCLARQSRGFGCGHTAPPCWARLGDVKCAAHLARALKTGGAGAAPRDPVAGTIGDVPAPPRRSCRPGALGREQRNREASLLLAVRRSGHGPAISFLRKVLGRQGPGRRGLAASGACLTWSRAAPHRRGKACALESDDSGTCSTRGAQSRRAARSPSWTKKETERKPIKPAAQPIESP